MSDFESAFVSDDYYGFLFHIKDEIGSGTSFGVGALFKVKDGRCKMLICSRFKRGQRICPVGKTWLIKNKVVPLQHGSYPIASSHPS